MSPTFSQHARLSTMETLSNVSSRYSLQRTRRFDGIQRSSRLWDGLRKDPELWIEDGDCLVHLYECGSSRRGPSLKFSLAILEESGSEYLLRHCLHRPKPSSPTTSSEEDDGSDSGYGASLSGDQSCNSCELFVPPPADAPRQEAFLYHLGTRNYFAYLLAKPVVGESLGKALTDLAKRIEQWQPDGVASTSFLDYCQEQGYLDYVENLDYAAASLYLAEQVLIKDIWLDAFAHCVAMREDLENCPEAEGLCDQTKASIALASSEMELHIERVTRIVGEFLEEDLGPEHLGITKALRNHLDRFRSFLHSHYVQQMGYFPPSQNTAWNKQLWHGMVDDFRQLYAYLADTESSNDRSSNRGLTGGICVTQNINAFDERHGCVPLPHPLPLLPKLVWTQGRPASEVPKRRKSLRLGWPDTAEQTVPVSAMQTMLQAANASDPAVTANRLVQEYIRFERSKLEEKVRATEARKVRWLLVYGVLQMLISITRAPPEVADSGTSSYPLCIPTTGCPPWMDVELEMLTQNQQAVDESRRLSAEMEAVRRTMESDRISIHPDCEADCAEDYFVMNGHGLSRTASDVSIGMMPPSRRSSISLRSGVNSLHRSVIGSLSRVNSSSRINGGRRNSIVVPSKKAPSFCEIVVEGYGNGTEEDVLTPPATAIEPSRDVIEEDVESEASTPAESTTGASHKTSQRDSKLEQWEAPWRQEMGNVPALELHQLHDLDTYGHEFSGTGDSDYCYGPSPATSQSSQVSSWYSDHMSAAGYDSPASELSSHDDGREDTVCENLDEFGAFQFGFDGGEAESDVDVDTLPPPLKYFESLSPRLTDGDDDNRPTTSLHAGCYVPTGAKSYASPMAQSRTMSTESMMSAKSTSSSAYGETNTQAAEIEEEETRGRRRLRGLDRIRAFGIVRAADQRT